MRRAAAQHILNQGAWRFAQRRKAVKGDQAQRFLSGLEFGKLLHIEHKHRGSADSDLNGHMGVHADRAARGDGRGGHLAAALAQLFDDVQAALKAVVVHANQQRGVARPQEAAGGGPVSYTHLITRAIFSLCADTNG